MTIELIESPLRVAQGARDAPLVTAPASRSHPRGMIIRAFAGDGDVVDMAFAQARAGDAHEARLALEFGDGLRADVAHGGAQAAGELVDDGADRAAVG